MGMEPTCCLVHLQISLLLLLICGVVIILRLWIDTMHKAGRLRYTRESSSQQLHLVGRGVADWSCSWDLAAMGINPEVFLVPANALACESESSQPVYRPSQELTLSAGGASSAV